MFSLKQKKNNEKQFKPKAEDQQNKNTNKQKPQSKKVAKTIFEDPFRYRIELLPQDETAQVQSVLIQYISKLREQMPYKPPRQGLKKVIKFQNDKNLKQKQSPLVSTQIVMGIKRTKSVLYKFYKKQQGEQTKRVPHLTLVFYDEKKHDVLQQLLCLIKMTQCPYLLLRDNLQINRLLGVRSVCSLCLLDEQFANSLLKFVGKCSIQVPWLVDLQQAWGKQDNQMSL